MNRLTREYPEIQVDFNPDVSHASIARYDIFFFQRPSNLRHLEVIQIAKEHGLPVWVDYDDDLFSLPPSNPHHAQYASAETILALNESINLADTITTTTEHLSKAIDPNNIKTILIPNAFDDMGPLLKRRDVQFRRQRISWRGTETHAADLLDCKDRFLELKDSLPKHEWLFFGAHPWVLGSKFVDSRHIPASTFMKYMARLQEEAPVIHVVPLADNKFNRSKSNIAWIEASYAGAAVIAPEWEEWSKPGITSFEPYDPENNAKLSWEFITDNLMLSKINQKRAEIVYKLMGLK